MNLFIRTDASVEIGTGHVMRCLTLAEDLKIHGAKVTFICRRLKGHLIDYIEKQGFKVHALPQPSENSFSSDPKITHSHWLKVDWQTDLAQTKAILTKQPQINWLIVDHYGLDEKWEREMSALVRKIMVIDDLADRKHYCQLLLDQNLHKNIEKRYEPLVPKDTVQLLGPKFAILRSEFRMARNQIKGRNETTVQRLLIFFGGSDPTNETIKTLEAIKLINKKELTVDVVVGSSNQNNSEIKSICNILPNTKFHCQIDYIAKLMLKADLSFGAGGSATLERCYLGLPTLTIETANNQADIITKMVEIGAIRNIGKSNQVTKEQIAINLEEIIDNPQELKKMSQASLLVMGDAQDENTALQYILGGP